VGPAGRSGLGNGSHTLSARAFDAAGNPGSSQAVAITVQNAGGGSRLVETFSRGGPDHPGWTFGGWALSASDATGTAGSQSLAATAAPRFATVTQTATWANLSLAGLAAPRLSYDRLLALSDANLTASAGLSVIINDGADHVVDAKAISGLATYTEASFTARTNLDLTAFAGKTVTLKLVLTATDRGSTVTRASASIDQIKLE
jgi:hypothetical protein